MAARKKKSKRTRPLSPNGFKKLVDNVVKRYGKVRIVCSDEPSPCDCMCDQCRDNSDYSPENRMRQITKDGHCKVSYTGDGYGRNFSDSCFLDEYSCEEVKCKCGAEKYNDKMRARFNYNPYRDILKNCHCEPIKTVKQTVQYMLDHDENEYYPTELRYGKRFSIKKKVRFKY